MVKGIQYVNVKLNIIKQIDDNCRLINGHSAEYLNINKITYDNIKDIKKEITKFEIYKETMINKLNEVPLIIFKINYVREKICRFLLFFYLKDEIKLHFLYFQLIGC